MRILLVLSILAISSCQQRREIGSFAESSSTFHKVLKDETSWFPRDEEIKGDYNEMLEVPSTAQPATTVKLTDRKLIKNGAIVFKVEDVYETKTQLDNLIKEIGGYSSNETQQNLSDQMQFNVTVRIPAHNFDDFIITVLKLALKVDSKNINAQDVTEEFIDVQARIKTKKELESRYHEILKQAKTVEEILAIESNLSTVRTEIESAEGKLNYLTSQISLSTLVITYYQPIGTDFGFAAKLINSFKDGWENLLAFLVGAVSVWPFVIIFSIGAFWLWKRLKRKPIPNSSSV